MATAGGMLSGMSDVTHILSAIEQGEPLAAGELLPLVYNELRQLAAQRLAGERPGHTLQPTALVYEAYLKLVGPGPRPPVSASRLFQGQADGGKLWYGTPTDSSAR